MKIIEISKEQFYNMLCVQECFSQGQFGIITLKDNKLYKIYYKDYSDTYLSKNIEKLDLEVNTWLENEEEANNGIRNSQKKANDFERLAETMSSNLITGVLSYRGLFVGVEMNYFEGFVSLEEAADNMTKSELDACLNNAWKLVSDLMNRDIAPTDVNENNILVNLETWQVVLIDLDGSETIYGPKNYIKDYHKDFMITRNFDEMIHRLNANHSFAR